MSYSNKMFQSGPIYPVTSINSCIDYGETTSNAGVAEAYNMFYYSTTSPKKVENEIVRKQEIEMCIERLQNHNVLFLYGNEGIGLSTLAAQFAKKHGTHCVSYFYNGLDRVLIDPSVVEKNIVAQLKWYVSDGKNFDYIEAEKADFVSLIHPLMKKMNESNEPLYFVFDGFDMIPDIYVEGISKLFQKILLSKARFIFTGDIKELKKILPDEKFICASEQQVLGFSESDVKLYFRNLKGDLSENDLDALCVITRCQANRMEIVRTRYILTGKITALLESERGAEADLYEDDFDHLFNETDSEIPYLFIALMTYVEFSLDIPLVARILGLECIEIEKLLKRYRDFISRDERGKLSFISESFHKYLRQKLIHYRESIELKIILVLEDPDYFQQYGRFIPFLYKDLNLHEQLIGFLNENNIHRFLIKEQSQAILNEQCKYGYESCLTDPEKFSSNLFRFAINKSTSREVEENKLWGYEIEALLSVDKIDQAIALAQGVYLLEEKLKSFVLIARRKDKLKKSDYQVIKEDIDQLITRIQFENIPEKAIEIARLLLPVDFEAAMGIVDCVAHNNKESINTDSVYTIMSLMSAPLDSEGANENNRDIVDTKIENEDLRTFTQAVKNLFADGTADSFLKELSKLPRNSQKLHLLEMWLPNHENMEGIGKVVLEGIRLIVAESDTSMPRARMLSAICKSMARMSLDEMERAVIFINSLGDSIKYPTFDYVDAELTIIQSSKDKMPDFSMKRLEDIYLYILDINDKSIRLSCLSKLLGRYDYLGPRQTIENNVVSTVDLRKEIEKGMQELLSVTACHLKIVEEPIKALVCGYSSMIEDFINGINTDERRSRAYSLAACYYILRIESNKLDLKFFFSLVSKASFYFSDRVEPLKLLMERLLGDEKLNSKHIFSEIKSSIQIFDSIESVAKCCRIYIRLYRWLVTYYTEESLCEEVKKKIIYNWRSINSIIFKIDFGFYLAKEFARVSKSEAETLLAECIRLKETAYVTSMSNYSACNEAVDIYTRSLCNLIHYGLCNDEKIEEFNNDVKKFLCKEDKIITWGKIALEYYLVNDYSSFRTICNDNFPVQYTDLPLFNQKCLIYQNASVLFLYDREKFYMLLKNYDELFANDCIARITKFIIQKNNFLSKFSIEHKPYNLAYDDYTMILSLMEHSTSDEYLFHTCDIMSLSLRKGRPKQSLSTEQKKYVVGEANRIIGKTLPVASGIRHNGYKIACKALLHAALCDIISQDKEEFKNEIVRIGNAADRAFLYFLIGPKLKRNKDREEFFNLGLAQADLIPASYDKVNRLDMSINECIDNDFTAMVKSIANKAIDSLSFYGSEEDHKHIIDAIYQYKPQLAEQLLDKLDNDPARVHYKKNLLDHISTKRKLDQAYKDRNNISSLNHEEQISFFSNQLKDLISNKAQPLDVYKAFQLSIQHIYDNTIGDASNAILYLLESIFQKNKNSGKYDDLLNSMHRALRYNLKLALSLAAENKECLNRIDRTISNSSYIPSDMLEDEVADEKINILLDWYKNCQYNSLYIIDPCFAPSNLNYLRKIYNFNKNVQISILTSLRCYRIEDYKVEWRKLFMDSISVQLDFVDYQSDTSDSPLHDHVCMAFDYMNELQSGAKVNNVGEERSDSHSIKTMQENEINSSFCIYTRYTMQKPKQVGNKLMLYENLSLSQDT